jgi:hypothetical protein
MVSATDLQGRILGFLNRTFSLNEIYFNIHVYDKVFHVVSFPQIFGLKLCTPRYLQCVTLCLAQAC